MVRYPDDPHDRIWFPKVNATSWNSISVTDKVANINNDLFEAPSKVMQTAVTSRNTSEKVEFSWLAKPSPKHPTPRYVANMHISELHNFGSNAVREFYINVNGELWYPLAVKPEYLSAGSVYSIVPFPASNQYDVSLNATINSTLPPIINAMEIFSIIPTTNAATDSSDGKCT